MHQTSLRLLIRPNGLQLTVQNDLFFLNPQFGMNSACYSCSDWPIAKMSYRAQSAVWVLTHFDEGKMDSFFGKILVASPALDPTPFSRSVILVLQHNQDATVGVVLNKPADDNVRRAWEGMVGPNRTGMLSIGGPLTGPIVAIHRVPEVGEIELPNGYYSSATEDNLQFLANLDDGPLQVFFGLTGWQTGQLEAEIENGHWLPTHCQDEFLFSQKDGDLWSNVFQRIQNRFYYDVLGAKKLPLNVEDN